mgnify:CR=1 FL=1
MQALQNTKLCFGVLRANSACKIAVRFAGGGGRPGARPSKFLFISIILKINYFIMIIL